MRETYYILGNGNLRVEENSFKYTSVDGIRRFPVENTRSINFFGGGNISTGAINLSSKYNISINFFGHYGDYKGSFFPKRKYFSGYLTIKQAEYYLNETKRLKLSKLLLSGIIRNFEVFLEKHSIVFDEYHSSLSQIRSIGDMMLLEARARKRYYHLLDTLLPDEFKLVKRTKRPPLNNGNTLISFGNSLLYSEIVSESRIVSLDPAISFYHSPDRSRYSLALDVSEVFKPYIVDQFVLRIIKRGLIQTDDFHPEGQGILLNLRGKKKFLLNWEKWMNEAYHHRKLNRKVSNRELLKIELFKLLKHYTEMEEYEPFIFSKRV